MGPTRTSRNVPYSLSTPHRSSACVPPPSILVRNCIVDSLLSTPAIFGVGASYRNQAAGVLQVLVLERVDRPISQRAQRAGRVPRGILRIGGCADDEHIRYVPRLQVAVDDAGFRIVAHHRSARVVCRLILSDGVGALACGTGHLPRTHGLADLD